MVIENNKVVTMHYHLTSPTGEVLDSSRGKDPLVYLHGHGNLIPGLESQLLGKTVGEKLTVDVAAADAYGERDPELVAEASRAQFPQDVELEGGMQFQAMTPQGPTVVTIVQVDGEKVTVDSNHPLAGVNLRFEVEVLGIRSAKPDEIDHGHVH